MDSLFIGFMVLICASFRSCHNNTKCGQLKVLELPTKVLKNEILKINRCVFVVEGRNCITLTSQFRIVMEINWVESHLR